MNNESNDSRFSQIISLIRDTIDDNTIIIAGLLVFMMISYDGATGIAENIVSGLIGYLSATKIKGKGGAS
jgi:hypothetical protein